VVASGLDFDNPGTVTTLDTVRFFTNNLNEVNFSGRTFDNLIISSGSAGPGDTTAPVVTITTPAEGATFTLNQVVLADFSCTDEASGSGIASCAGDVAAGSAIDTASLGAKTFSVTGTDVAGNSSSVTNNYTVTDGSTSILLEDDFNRPNSSNVGTGWVEVGQTGGNVAINNNQLFFEDTSNILLRPLVRRSFSQPVSSGTIQWDFDFNWTRDADDPGYELWMQLGDSTLMVNPISGPTSFAGVGVGLRWSGPDQNLAARQNGTTSSLGPISGPTHLSVTIDLDTQTFSVAIDGVVVASGLDFDNPGTVTTLDTVRFFTNNLNEVNFSGRTFDNLLVTAE
jgi:hypothetical protein